MIDPIVDLVMERMYANYCGNRVAAPDLPPEHWRYIYGKDVERFEVRYQVEQSQKRERYAEAKRLEDSFARMEGPRFEQAFHTVFGSHAKAGS